MKIIIVDDDCLVAGALKTILEVNEDVEVLATGADGKEACELYERYEPDVLLMDIRMEKNGRSGSIPEYFVQVSKGKYSASYHFFR